MNNSRPHSDPSAATNVASNATDYTEQNISLEVSDAVKSAPAIQPNDADQPIVSLDTTVAVKSMAAVQPQQVTAEVATSRSLEAVAGDVAGIAVSIPKRHRRFHAPKVKPLHIPVKIHTFDSLRYRNFRFVWGASLFFSGAFWLQTVIIGWLTYSLTQSAMLTSIAMGLDALPILIAGPLGGMIVDSMDRRKLLILAYGYQAVLTAALAAIVFMGILESWHIFGFIFLMGISWVINDPARMSLISNSVPKESLVNAFALNGLAFSVTRLAAPTVGGVVLAFAGPGPALLIQIGLQIGAGAMAWGIRLPQTERAAFKIKNAFSGIVEGARYVKSEPLVMGLMMFGAIPAVLIMPFAHGLLPVYTGEVYNVGPAKLGLLMSAIGAGSLLGTLVIASIGDVRHKGKVIVASLALTAIGMAAFSQNESLNAAYPLVMMISIGIMGFFSTTSATIQSIVPDHLRGRVIGIYILSFGMMPFGSLAAGFIAQQLGAQMATLIGGGLVLLVLAALTLVFRQVWRLE